MKKIIYLLVCLSLKINTLGAQELETLALPEKFNTSDLSFLNDELKDVQIVLLGEISHFDGNVFQVKAKIAEYLHKNLGFNTIAFEAGTYDLFKAQKEIQKGINTSVAFKNSLFGIWGKTKEFQDFVTLYDNNKDHLKLYGFDEQISGKYGTYQLVADLYEYCKTHQLTLKLNQNDFQLLIESILSGYYDENDIPYNQFITHLKHLKKQIQQLPINDSHFYWSQITDNLLAYTSHFNPKHTTPEKEQKLEAEIINEYATIFGVDKTNTTQLFAQKFDVSKYDNARDKQMAKNLLAYIKRHPNEKIICWGANAHFVNDMSSVQFSLIKDFIPMGSYIKSELKDKVYSLVTVTAETHFNKINLSFETPIKPNSFEDVLINKKQPYVFVSSKQKAMQTPINHRLFSIKTFIKSDLSTLHDGYLFLDKAIPATKFYDDETDSDFSSENNQNKESSYLKTINCKIINANTQQPVPYASVAIDNTSLGTASNENGSFALPYITKNDTTTVTISCLGFTTIKIPITKIKGTIELSPEFTALEEVELKTRLSPYTIVKKAIKNSIKNYPKTPLEFKRFSKTNVSLNDTSYLNVDFITKGLVKGYHKPWRTIRKLEQIKWNLTPKNRPKLLWELLPNRENAIMDAKLFDLKKIKKFQLHLNNDEIVADEDVYVIDFYTNRNHYSYTNLNTLSNYSGTLYISKTNFAIIKIKELWDIFGFYESTVYNSPELNKGWAKDYTEKTLKKISKISTYKKGEHNLYYQHQSIIESSGILNNSNKKETSYVVNSKTEFYDYQDCNKDTLKLYTKSKDNPKKDGAFESVTYSSDFWDTFNLKD